MTTDISIALGNIPSQIRGPLISEYEEALRASLHSDWEKLGLKAGKFCEIAYCVCHGFSSGTYAASPFKPKDMRSACADLEKLPQNAFPRALRIQIPRLLIALYEMRNNRAIGHAGGDLEPNQMDGLLFLQGMKWILAEFVRMFYSCDINSAQQVVDSLATRWNPVFWEKDGKKVLLHQNATAAERTVITLYFSDLKAPRIDVQRWVEYANATDYKRKVLKPLHSKRLIFFDNRSDAIDLLPPGIAWAEQLLRKLAK